MEMVDRKKEFLKKNPGLVPSDEEVLGVLIVEPKGGAWRRGIASAGALGDLATSRKEQGADPAGDEAAAWPQSRLVWLVLTDKQLHAFQGAVGSGKAGPEGAHYGFDRIGDMKFSKKLLISKLDITFKDGASLTLDVSKQKLGPFTDAMSARFPS
jgi:hypothetical protein